MPRFYDQPYIDRMIEIIGELIARGLAYNRTTNGFIVRINKFSGLTASSRLRPQRHMQSTGLVKHDEYDTNYIGDFSLLRKRVTKKTAM